MPPLKKNYSPPRPKKKPRNVLSNIGREGFNIGAQVDRNFETNLMAEYLDGQSNKYGLKASVPADRNYFADPTGQTRGTSQSAFSLDNRQLEAYMNLKPSEKTFFSAKAGLDMDGSSWGVEGGYKDELGSVIASTNQDQDWRVASELNFAEKLKAQANISKEQMGGGLTYDHLADSSSGGVGNLSAFINGSQNRQDRDDYRVNAGFKYRF